MDNGFENLFITDFSILLIHLNPFIQAIYTYTLVLLIIYNLLE